MIQGIFLNEAILGYLELQHFRRDRKYMKVAKTGKGSKIAAEQSLQEGDLALQ